LTRHDVLSTALRLIDEDGVDALTMRRLGRALDRDPMRLYRYAASKDELLDGIVDGECRAILLQLLLDRERGASI